MKNTQDAHNVEMRAASGGVHATDRLVSFFYDLMRDHMTPGDVETIVRRVLDEEDREVFYTNGWLAENAKYIAARLLGDKEE